MLTCSSAMRSAQSSKKKKRYLFSYFISIATDQSFSPRNEHIERFELRLWLCVQMIRKIVDLKSMLVGVECFIQHQDCCCG